MLLLELVVFNSHLPSCCVVGLRLHVLCSLPFNFSLDTPTFSAG